MKVKIKKLHPKAVIPKYSKTGDAGMDLMAISRTVDEHQNIVYGTGLAFEIPEGYVGLVFPRSSNSKTDILLTNSVGVIDSGYRGEVMFKFGTYRSRTKDYKTGNYDKEAIDICSIYDIGDRIGQIIILPYPQIEFEESKELTESERGINGYGSTGN